MFPFISKIPVLATGSSEFDVRKSFRMSAAACTLHPHRNNVSSSYYQMNPNDSFRQSNRFRRRKLFSTTVGYHYNRQEQSSIKPMLVSSEISKITTKTTTTTTRIEMATTTNTPKMVHHHHNNNNPETKLSILAQFDDMCRFSNSLTLSPEDIEKIIKHFEKYEELRQKYVGTLKDLGDKEMLIAKLEDKIDYLNCHLKSLRVGYCREVESKVALQRQYNDLRKKMEQVRELMRTEETQPKELYNDATRNHLMSVLKNLDTMESPMDASDDGLLFDKSNENIDQDHPMCKAPKVAKMDIAEPKAVPAPPPPPPSSLNNMKRTVSVQSYHPMNGFDAISEASNEDQDNREMLNTGFVEADAEKVLYSNPSTPSVKSTVSQHRLSTQMRNHRLARLNSKLEPDRLNTRNHRFQEKKAFKPTTCSVCNKNIKFCSSYAICVECRGVVHLNCQDLLPKPCLPIVSSESVRNMISGVKGRLMMIADFTVKNTRPCVPALLIHCCNEIDRRVQEAMNKYANQPNNSPVVGLYRICAVERDVRELRNKILQSKHGMPKLNDVTDVHVICGAIKLFLRDLDDPLVTRILWNDFVRAADHVIQANKSSDSGLENDSGRSSDEDSGPMMVFKHVILDLPVANKDSLAFLMLHLRNIAKAETVTKMTVAGLTSIFAPTIVGNSEARQLSSSTLMKENTRQLMVMEALFLVDEAFWNSLLKDPDFCPYPKKDDCLKSVASFGIKLAKISASNLKSLAQEQQQPGTSSEATETNGHQQLTLPPSANKVPICSFVDNIQHNRKSFKTRLNNVLY